MQAVKMKLFGKSFLLPLSHQDNYEFPNYIIENKEDIKKCIDAYNEWITRVKNGDYLADMPPAPDMKDFKKTTGIIGIPFNTHDVDLYIMAKGVDVVLEVEL